MKRTADIRERAVARPRRSGREIGPIGTASRVVGGVVTIVVPIEVWGAPGGTGPPALSASRFSRQPQAPRSLPSTAAERPPNRQGLARWGGARQWGWSPW